MTANTAVNLLTTQIQQLQATLDQVGAYIFTKDMQGRYTFANKLVCDLFGCPPDEVVGYTDEKFFDLSVSNQLRLNDRRVLDLGERIESEETNIIAATGETRIYWSVKIPWKDTDGKIGGMCGLSTDITERRRLEMLVQEQKLLLDTILNNVDSYVYMKNHECRYLYVNEKTANLFGMPKENVIGKLDANILPKKDADRFGVIDRQVLDTGQRYCGEEILLDSDGSQRHYWSVKIPLAKDGKVSSYVGISTDITEVVRLKEKFQLLANTDSLAGTFSRRYLIECAEHELKRMRRSGETMAVIMFDLDRFKSVNDSYGHATGDRAIIAVAEACKKNLREIDWLGRMGGDEFVVVLPDIDLASTLVVAERIREAICATPILCDDGSNISVTSSFGITMSDSSSSFDELLARSDAALYVAKNRGRNCVWHDQGLG